MTAEVPAASEQRAALSEAEREALSNAGDHHPDVCDCTGRAADVRYEPGWGEICGGLEDTYAAVERILADRAAAEDHGLRGSVYWEARAVIAEAQVAAIRDMWSERRWLDFSMLALHQIRDRILDTLDAWDRA